MKNLGSKQKRLYPEFNFRSASAEALKNFLDALKAELDQAMAQNRAPCWEGVWKQLGPSCALVQ